MSYSTGEEEVEEHGNRFIKTVIRAFDSKGNHTDTMAISKSVPVSRVEVDRQGRMEVYTTDDKGKEWKIIKTRK